MTSEFNVFTGIDGSYTHRFSANSQYQPVRLGCDIHPWMRGWIYVFDHRFFATTDAQGRFVIPDVPPGSYTLMVRQPDIRYATNETVVAQAGETLRLQFQISGRDLQPSE